MPMPTTATGEDSRAILPTPKNLFDQTPVKSTTPLSLLLEDIAVTTENSWVCHKRIPKRASLELAFELFASGMTSVPKICHELDVHGLCQPMSFVLNGITRLSSQQLNKSRVNIWKARERFIACLHNQGPPRDGQLLHLWLSDMKRYGQG